MKRRKKMIKRRIETVVIYGVKRLRGEKSSDDLARSRERQYPRSNEAPSCTSSARPNRTKKEVTFDLLLYWSRKSQRLMFRDTSSSRWKLKRVRAQSTEEMLLHCSCPLLAENEHSMVSVSKLVSRSSRKCSGNTTHCDSILRNGRIAEEGREKQSHFGPRSRASTNFVTGSTHLVLSSDVSMDRSQKRTPFLQPRAFCSSQPPSCKRSCLPPGAEQKLTTSC